MAKYQVGVEEENIVCDGATVLTVRWGCDCCKDFSPLTPEEIAFRDKVVKALNHYDAMHRMLKRIHKHSQLPWGTYMAVGRLLERIEK